MTKKRKKTTRTTSPTSSPQDASKEPEEPVIIDKDSSDTTTESPPQVAPVAKEVKFIEPQDESSSDSGMETETSVPKIPRRQKKILKPARRTQKVRIKGSRRIAHLFPTRQQQDRLEMYGYSVLVDICIQNLKIRALFDTGATNTVISPRVLAMLHTPPDCLPYDRSYGGASPDMKIPSQGVVQLPFRIEDHLYQYRAVVADIDGPLIIGADFMIENGMQLHFSRKGGVVKDTVNNVTFPLNIERRHMAQWLKTKITECIQPGEEKAIAARMVNYQHRARPSPGEGGMLEPSVALRAKGALVPYVYLNAHEDTPITVYNTGEEPLWLDAGTILGCWTPAKILSRIPLENEDLEDRDDPTQYDVSQPREDPGYASDICSDEESTFEGRAGASETEWESDEDSQNEESPQLSRVQEDQLPAHLEDLIQASDLTRSRQKTQLRRLLRRYQDVMVNPKSPLGKTPMAEHRIDTGDALPIRQPMRPPAKSLAGASEAEIQKMLDQGLIRPSDSPWASPVVLVRKKDGTIRFCVDYRRLNEVTRKDAYPLPRIDACFDCLGRSSWFCTLDLRSGYWQVPVQEDDIEKTAFITPQGLYEYLVMPFGLTNAPATFERLMEKVLKGLQWKQCLVYIDDIIVFGATFEETLDNLGQVLQRLRQAKLTCKPKKCELFRRRVSFLGHIVSEDGLECDPEKIAAVENWPVPKTVKDIRSFLGLAGYYRRFIKNFANYSAPLTELTKTNVPFEWTKTQQQAFDALKSSLCNPPVLSYPTEEGMYVLDTDASNYGIGAVLSQVQGEDQEERVIAYASKTLQGAQKTYCTTKKELFAMVYFVKYFRHYLLGRRFLVRTDHASLLWLLNFRNPEGILARWLMTLSSYMPFDYITHRPGKDHGNADAMSRKPVEKTSNQKRCPKTYVGCPSCYPGAITVDMTPGDRDLTAQIAAAKANLSRSKKKKFKSHKRVRMATTPDEEIQNPDDDEAEHLDDSEMSRTSPQDGTVPLHRANFESWTFGWSTTYLRQMQREDADIKTVLTRHQHHSTAPRPDLKRRESHELKTYWSQWTALTVIDGLLYRRYKIRPETDQVLQLVVPKRLRAEILTYAHDLPQAAHRGEHGTFGTVRSRFFWPTYRRDVKLHVRACERCQKSKPRDPGRAPLTQVSAGEPMECCAMDLLGPFDPPTDSGNRYILVIGDVFSKWIEAYAIPNKEAVTVAKKLTEFFCRFGIPQRLHSDRGKEFHNQILDEVSKLLHIQPTFTTAYRPQSNGMIERFNRTLIKMLKTFIDDFVHPTTWDTLLPMLTGAYRATEHSSTKCTPNLLFMGREVHLPVDVLAGTPPRQRTFYNAASYGQWLARSMSMAHQYARRSLEKAAIRQKRGYDQRMKTRKWTPSIGEWVYLYYPPYSRYKLGSPWVGPYVVIGQGKARTWLIQAAPDKPVRVAHEDNLKSVQGRLQQQDNWIRQKLKLQTQPSQDEEDCYISPPESDEENLEEDLTDKEPEKQSRKPPTRPATPTRKKIPPVKTDPPPQLPSADPSPEVTTDTQPVPDTADTQPVPALPPEIPMEELQPPDVEEEENQHEVPQIPDEMSAPENELEVEEEQAPILEELPPTPPDSEPQQDVPEADEQVDDSESIASPAPSSEPLPAPSRPTPEPSTLRRSTRERHAPKRYPEDERTREATPSADSLEPVTTKEATTNSTTAASIIQWFLHYFDPG